MATWFPPERHREALLWSYLVARWGSTPERASDDPTDPSRNMAPIDRIWYHLVKSLSNKPAVVDVDNLPPAVDVLLPVRSTLPDEQSWNRAKMDPPKGTDYTFSKPIH